MKRELYSGQSTDPFDTKRAKSNEGSSLAAPAANLLELVTDKHLLSQRQKQIDFGKNSLTYERYKNEVPHVNRKASDPQTPDIRLPDSKRRFDGKVKAWRRGLHEWENANPVPPTAAASSSEAPAATAAGLTSGGAGSFDDYLDDLVGDDDVEESDVLVSLRQKHEQPAEKMSEKAQQPVPVLTAVATVAKPAPLAPTPTTEGSAAAADDRASLRRRLDSFKQQQQQPPPAGGTGAAAGAGDGSIFGRFDDGL